MSNLTFRRFAVNAGAILAVSATVAGVAYASAPRNSVTSASIKNNTIVSADIKNNTIASADIKNGTITAADVKSNSLLGSSIKNGSLTGADLAPLSITGAQVNDSTLTGVVHRKEVLPIYVRLTGGQDVELVSNGTISVRAKCASDVLTGDALDIYAKTSVDGAFVNSRPNGNTPLNIATAFGSVLMTDSVNTGVQGTFSNDLGYDETGYVMDSTSTKTIDLVEGTAIRILNRGGTRCFFSGTFNLTGA